MFEPKLLHLMRVALSGSSKYYQELNSKETVILVKSGIYKSTKSCSQILEMSLMQT